MSNKRRQFLGIAAGAIAVPATSSLVLAQGNPSRGREVPIPAQTSVPERRSAKSELRGLSALLTPEECVVVLIDHQPFPVRKSSQSRADDDREQRNWTRQVRQSLQASGHSDHGARSSRRKNHKGPSGCIP